MSSMDDPRPSNQEIRDALKAICDSEVFEIKNTVREMLGFIVDSALPAYFLLSKPSERYY